VSGHGLVPPEAWDRTHPDHNWWVNGRGWCFDEDCPDHVSRKPGDPEPDLGDLGDEEDDE
jgi:hypothetical protein